MLEINSDSSSSIVFNGKNVQNNSSTNIMLMPASTANSLMFLFPNKTSANSPYTLATTSDIPSTTGMVTSSTSGLKIEVV
jgi:galactokinase/mevalonate kinase-like predicted kinase